MNEKRRYQRIRLEAKCSLTHNNITYLGKLENISLNGALISFNDGLIIPKDDRCSVTIYLDGLKAPIKSDVSVIHSNFTMLGIKFTSIDATLMEVLDNLVERPTSGQGDPDKNAGEYVRESEG